MEIDNETISNLLAGQGRVEGKLDMLLLDYAATKLATENRLSIVEKKTNIASGVVAVLVFLVSPVLALFGIWHRSV